MDAKIAAAQAAGYSNADIVDHLTKSPEYSDKVAAARSAGYSDDDIVGHLAGKAAIAKQSEAPAAVTPEPSKPAETEKKLTLPEYAMGGIRSALRGLTVGTSDVIGSGVAAAAASALDGANFPAAYSDIKSHVNADRDQFRNDAPVVSGVSELAGAVAPMVVTLGASAPATAATAAAPLTGMARALQVGKGIATGAGLGAAQGGTYGASQADEGHVIDGGIKGAEIGAAFGAALPAAAPAVMKGVGMLVPKKSIQNAVTGMLDSQFVAHAPEITNNIVIKLAKDGIDFNKLSAEGKKSVIDYATKATMTGADNVVAAGRKAVLDGLPVPFNVTRGRLNKDYIAQQKEGLIADSSPILGRDLAENIRSYQPKLVENLDALAGKTGGKADDLFDAGKSLRGTVEARANASKQNITAAYKKAEDMVGDYEATLGDDAIAWMHENTGVTGVDSLINKAKGIGAVVEKTAEDGSKVLEARPVPIKKLSDLRSQASTASADGGTAGHMAGQLKGIVDNTIDWFGGDLYKNAATLRRQHALQYESGPKVISDILKKRGGSETDKAIANEDLFAATIVRGSAEDVKKLYGYMLNDKAYRKEGVQQIKDLRSMAIENLKAQSTAGQGGFTPAAFNKALKQIGGREKLEAVFGKDGYSQLLNFQKAADIALNTEKSVSGGSQSASRLAMAFEAVADKLGKLPVVGPAASAGVKVVSSVARATQAKNALTNPLDDLAPQLFKQAQQNMLLAPTNDALRRAAVVSFARPSSGGEQ